MNNKQNIRDCFNKKFSFRTSSNEWLLPNYVFKSAKWEIPLLQSKKEKLNQVKSLLNQYNFEEWSKHTKYTDSSSFIIKFLKQSVQPELVTQAWCKFYECLSQYPIIRRELFEDGGISSFHLCEAPGGFICSLNHYLQLHYPGIILQWSATTLNPNYEGNSTSQMISDDRLIRWTEDKWYFGLDQTGNIMKYYNYLALVDKIGRSGKVSLVTADGSVDCMSNPGEQERSVEYLHYCETMTALAILREGGSFVIKIFTIFEESTICLLYLLNCTFKNLDIFKPSASKSGNSEVYVICTQFKGKQILEHIWDDLLEPYKSGHFNDKSMFELEILNEDYLHQIISCVDFFMKLQIKTILNNISRFKQKSPELSSKLHHLKTCVAKHFISRYKINKISRDLRVVPYKDISKFHNFGTLGFSFYGCECDIVGLLDTPLTPELLNVKYGAKLQTVQHSKFCSDELIPTLNFPKCSCGELYNKALQELNNVAVINIKNCQAVNYSDFHRQFFNELSSTLGNENVLIINIPLVTNFLVGLFLLFSFSYDKLYFCKSGSLLLYSLNCISLTNVKACFLEIEKALTTSVNLPFDADVIQITSPQFFNDHFIHLIYEYNNSIVM